MIDQITDFLSKEGWLNTHLELVNDFLWGWHSLVFVLVLCGIYFTFRTKFVQFRMFPEMCRLLVESSPRGKEKHHVSSFQAFALSYSHWRSWRSILDVVDSLDRLGHSFCGVNTGSTF